MNDRSEARHSCVGHSRGTKILMFTLAQLGREIVRQMAVINSA